jgi:hypothetical protein
MTADTLCAFEDKITTLRKILLDVDEEGDFMKVRRRKSVEG